MPTKCAWDSAYIGARFDSGTSIVFSIETIDDATGETVVRGHEVYVVIDAEIRKPTPVPDAIREAFEALV